MDLRMTRAEREAFLADVHVGVLSIAEPGRGPLAAPIWYGYEPGGEIWLMIAGLDQGREAEIRLPGRYRLDGALRGALKSAPGVVMLEDA